MDIANWMPQSNMLEHDMVQCATHGGFTEGMDITDVKGMEVIRPKRMETHT
jgi:hypothetical protein